MKRYLLVVNERKRRAVSEIMGTILMVAVTLIAGAAVFGWVNGQAGNSEKAYGESVANNVNYLQEHFIVLGSQYQPLATTSQTDQGGTFTAYVYNNGNLALTVAEIEVTNNGGNDSLNIQASATAVLAFSEPGTLPSNLPNLIADYNVTAGRWICPTGATSCTTTACTSPPSIQLPTTTIPENKVPPTSVSVTLPICGAQISVDDATSYSIGVMGLYGNVAQSQVQASW